MMYSHDGGWWWLMVVTSTLFWVALIAVVIAAVALVSRSKQRSDPADRPTPQPIVAAVPGRSAATDRSSTVRRS